MTTSTAHLVIDADAILTPFERFVPGRISVRNGIIDSVGTTQDVRIPQGAARIDAAALTIAPGFIDPHIHGCAGAEVMDATFDSIDVMSAFLASHGTTAFLPTTVSTSPGEMSSVLEKLGGLLDRSYRGAQPLGLHLEGPFLNKEKCGAHRVENIQKPDVTLLKDWLQRSAGRIKLLTMAPELEGVGDVAAVASQAGIQLAMGHSNASYAQAESAVNSGFCYAVHVFNAMREFTHREPGIVGAVLSDDRVFTEVIADGVHVHPEVVRLLSRAKPRNRVLLITDATSATGMPDGQYRLGMDSVSVTNGICRNFNGRLAGSTLTQDAGLKNFMKWTGASLQDALFGLTVNPAEALQFENRGRLQPGMQADFVMLNEEFQVMKTFVAGNLVFERHD